MTVRVAHVLNSPGLGGVPRVVKALIQRLNTAAMRHDLFFLKGEASELASYKALTDTITIAGAGQRKLDTIAQLVQWLSVNHIDILHTHSYRPNLIGRLAGALLRPRGLKVISHYHNFYDEKWSADPSGRVLECHLADSTDVVVTISSAVRDHLLTSLHIPKDKIVVVQNGVDVDRLQPADRVVSCRQLGLNPGATVVGMIGRICHQKGVDTFVKAALMLTSQHPELSFLVVGSHEDLALVNLLNRQIDSAGMADRIVLVGHQADVAPAYGAIDLLCVPSRWEGFGLVVVEGMHQGIPIIASDVGALPEVLGDVGAGCLVAPDDAGTLADAISRLGVNPALRAAMGERGRQRAIRFDWDAAATQLAEVYRQVLSAK